MASPKEMVDPFAGFIEELVVEVAKRANFTAVRVNISNYPMMWQEEGENYDMFAADFSISEKRNINMEFSIPFMKYGLTVLMKNAPTEVSFSKKENQL